MLYEVITQREGEIHVCFAAFNRDLKLVFHPDGGVSARERKLGLTDQELMAKLFSYNFV